MKKLVLSLLSVAAAAAFAAPVETTTTTTTTAVTTGTGTITEYTPGSAFVLKENTGPVHYHYGDHVTYVGKDGKELKEDEVRTRIKVGGNATVHYTKKGEDRVISRVEVGD